MVSELSEGHATDWDVYLPARVFALCFQERPGGGGGGQRPFSLLCCAGLQPVRQPRGLQVGPALSSLSARWGGLLDSPALCPQVTDSEIQKSLLVVRPRVPS